MFTTLLPIEKPVNKPIVYRTMPSRVETVIETPTEKAVETKEEITISMVGDILMDGSVRGQIDINGVDYPWEHVKDYFQRDNITIGNLETSITNRGTIWPDKQYNFRSDPKNLRAMKEAGIEVINLGNNHTLDYGYDGFLDTLKHLDNNNIKRVGGGKTREEAMEGIVIEEGGTKVGVLGFSRVVPTVDWYATAKRPGIVGAYDVHVDSILERVSQMKEEVDILILSIHWGVELSEIPRQEEILLAKKLIDGGVDIVMGHHPHVLQGIEIYKGKPIFYSLGNFVFGAKNELTGNTIIAQVNLLDSEVDNVKIIPCKIISGRPIPLGCDERLNKIQYLNEISKEFNTNITSDGIIRIK